MRVKVPPRSSAAETLRYARYPHIANNAQITFSYMDDIWVAEPGGTNPRRVTNNVARDINPRFSPDGAWIAFSSNRMGNNDVYIVSTAGGEPKQLTWHTGDDVVQYWTPDGKEIVFTSSRSTHPFLSPLYKVDTDGHLPTALPMDVARNGMIRQDNAFVAYNRNGQSYWRKGYKGNAVADVAVQDLRTGEVKEISYTDMKKFRTQTSDYYPMWGADGKIYVSSERDGTFNIWRMNIDGTGSEQVTRFRTGGITFPAISPDGKRMIFEQEFDLWTLDLPAGTPKRVTLSVTAESKANVVEMISVENRAQGFAVNPAGDYLAVDNLGEIFVVPAENGIGEKSQITSSSFRERSALYSPDGRKIAYISDASGDDEVWVHDATAGTHKQISKQESVKSNVRWAPNGQKLAWVGDNKLWEADLASGRVAELAYNSAGGFTLGDYTADGNWIAYTKGDDNLNIEVFAFDVRTKREYNVSQNPFNDRSPTITPDGSTIVFISNRDGGVNHLFAVSLTKLGDDPNDPLVRERARRAAGGAAGGGGAAGAGRGGRAGGAGGGQDSTAAAPVSGPAPAQREIQINLDRIANRAVQLTRGANDIGGGRGGGGGGGGFGGGATSYFLSRDGRTVFFLATEGSEQALFSVGLDGRDRRRIATGPFADVQPTADRRAFFYSQAVAAAPEGEAPAVAGVSGSQVWRYTFAGNRKDRITFSFPVSVDARAQWNQIFEESWRVMKYRFYDAKMHGKDWDAIKAKYKPMLAHIASNEDVYALSNEMIGELNASHTGVSGPSSVPAPRGYATRFLGFEMEPTNGRYRVSHIYMEGPADKEWLDIAVGDYVLAIDGKDVKAGDNYWKILSNTLNEYVSVRYSKTATGEAAKTARIATVTAGALTNLKYEQWVEDNRKFVEKQGNGDVAYVHIRSMNQPSLERFRNEINRFWNRKAIVVDIRFNGGGNIDQELLDILERKPYEYWNPRMGSRAAGRRPREAIDGPKIMLTNHRSGSDSEVTPMGFRQLGIGTIVGQPTAGAVIATGSYALINGGSIRTPGSLVVTYDNTKPNNYGINLENYGVAPDIWVRNTPMDELKKFDRELKESVDEALRQMKRPVP